MNFENKYIKYKTKYLQLKNTINQIGEFNNKLEENCFINNQTGGINNKFEENCFINKSLYYTHVNIEYRKKRINDFNDIYKKLKNHLKPKGITIINKKKMEKYINMHKKENRPLIRQILEVTQHISFDEFKKNLFNQIEFFNNYLEQNNIKKYIFCIGVGNDGGSSDVNFNIYKSNFWTFLLSYHLLKIKPFDIMLNLKEAIRIYYNESSLEIDNFLIMDDCTYSGNQVVDRVIYSAAAELMHTNKNSFMTDDLTKKTIYHPIQNKVLNVHYIIPYLSKIAYDKLKLLELKTQINVIIYTNNIINPYKDIINKNLMDKIKKLYSFYTKYNIDNLIPIFFDHKIADSLSTIDLILIKGQVLDNPNKRYVFIDACTYNKNDPDKEDFNPKTINGVKFNDKKIYCPKPPYLYFSKLLK